MANTSQIKQINIDKVKEALRSGETYTKISLAAETNLSVATCGNILNELLESKEIHEIDSLESTGGRPSRQFVFNGDYAYVLALYVRREGSKKNLSYAVTNLLGDVVKEDMINLDKVNLSSINSVVGKRIDEFPKINAISIGVPSVVNNGVTGTCDFSELDNVDARTYFIDKYDINVIIENDVNCTALGYYDKIEDKADESLVYLYYPIKGGAGAGIIINGRVLRGANNFSGEVGYLPHYHLNEENIPWTEIDYTKVDYVGKTIVAINSIINPKTVVLSGLEFNEANLVEIEQFLKSSIPQGHVPNLMFEEDIHLSYMSGLISIALESLKCNYTFAEKNYIE